MRKITLLAVLLLIFNQGNAQVYDTFDVHFKLNDPQLGRDAIDTINNLLGRKSVLPGAKLTILGYTDYLGSVEYNKGLSKTRAQNVKDYLVIKGFDTSDIVLCIGKGKIEHAPVAGGDGIATDRKVQIIVPKPEPPRRKQNTDIFTATTWSAPFDFNTINTEEPILLKDVFFYTGSHQLKPESGPELYNLYNFLKYNPTVKIQIEGHMCCLHNDPDYYEMRGVLGNDSGLIGDGKAKALYHHLVSFKRNGKLIVIDQQDIDNSGKLSETRAKAVFDFLVSYGISENRLTQKGYGVAWPLYFPAVTEEQEDLNKRVGIRILSR